MGGDWEDPARRWELLDRAIADWREDHNTFPALPSHPQRLVGWATLALSTDSLVKAKKFAGHARLHIRISQQAVEDC